jgi:Fe-S cluster assembly iron-binding protein IscA
MLTVTANAKAKLEELLRDQRPEPGMAVRISPSPEGGDLQLAWDRKGEEDQVVESDQGETLLLVGSDVAPKVDGRVMDYQEPPQGSGFVFTPAGE